MNRALRLSLLAALVLLGAWLRFWAIGFGLPDKFRPDEDVLVVRALNLKKDWNPDFGNLTFYPAAQLYLLHTVFLGYAKVAGNGNNLQAAFGANDQSLAFLIGREVSAAMGTATVAAAYWASEVAFGPVAAISSAAIVAVSSLHVRESKFVKIQAPSALWFVLAMGMILRIARRGRYTDYASAGLFSALAIATNYQAAIIVVGVLAAHFEALHRENRPLMTALADGRIYVAGSVTALTFVCATPYTALNLNSAYNLAMAIGRSETRGWWFLLSRVMPDTLGVTLMVFFVLSLLWVVSHPRRGVFSLLALVVANFAILIVHNPSISYRYALNPILVMALLAGIFAADLLQLATGRLGAGVGAGLSVALFTLILVPSLVHDVELNHLLLQPDTRVLAREWILKNHPPPLIMAGTDYDPIFNTYGKPPMPLGYKYVVFQNVESVASSGIRWILSDSLPGIDYSPGPSSAQAESLKSDATLLFDLNPIKPAWPAPTFDPNDAFYVPFQHISSMINPGPRIRIWEMQPPTPIDPVTKAAILEALFPALPFSYVPPSNL